MEACSACGFRNLPSRDTCAKCGAVFRERKDVGAGIRRAAAAVVSILIFVAVVAGTLFKIFGPSRMELKKRAAQERQAREEEGRATTAAGAPPARAPEPVSVKSAEAPAPPEKRPDSPTRKQGEEQLRRADRLFADGDYPGAVTAYREAEFLGARMEEAAHRREAAQAVVRIAEIRDYLARESQIEPSWVTAGHWNLKNIDPSRLPSDAWREEHRRTFKRLEELVEGTARPAPRPVEPRLPPLIASPAAFNRSFKLEQSPRRGADGKTEGAFVMWLYPDSLLALAGVKPGDLLVEVNGKPVESLDLVGRIETDRGFWGKVVRKGERIPFKVEFPSAK